ncbi:iron dicitrate transport regulator FecR [Chitinophaga parva]|uniref:Iron dicitrate transport regulator FecR n=1 Tax=Chitinophaga parva TaxID=2169414 RepID=A0A2T7BGX8_9BACT|nr:FecR domain-containing protein [Chitinophaga parva]PUZ25539.1 iron dicitrate transport regulator FecR [Chitinophaga parva]
MDLQRINELINKLGNGTASLAEQQELMDWYRATGYQDAAFPGNEEQVQQELLQRIHHATGLHPVRSPRYRKWAVAASVALLCATGAGLYLSRRHATPVTYATTAVKPGSNQAILTLANGKQIVLSTTANGNIATQGNVRITKAANGQLLYEVTTGNTGADTTAALAYNTISTPAGGQYKIVLPDQTTVWLNSMSSLRFPVSFSHTKERRVELTGEGYFDVVHNEAQPFKVVTGAFVTEDIGTAFNIKAYADENNISTTLVKGAAQVTAGGAPVLLKPGQQARYQGGISVTAANVEAVTAWKEGYFRFDDDALEDIMKTIARWYNVQYVFEDESLRKETYGAVTTRFSNIATLLNLMEKAGTARFRIDGNTIIISKKKELHSNP